VTEVNQKTSAIPRNTLPEEDGNYLIKLIKSYDWNDEIAIEVFRAESGLNPKAVHKNRNGTMDLGIAQINTIHCGKVKGNCLRLLEPEENLRVAYEIYKTSGWCAWVKARKYCK
jgi:hypothetical protein